MIVNKECHLASRQTPGAKGVLPVNQDQIRLEATPQVVPQRQAPKSRAPIKDRQGFAHRRRFLLMGFRVLLIAVTGKEPDAIHREYGVVPTGEHEQIPESPVTGAKLSSG